MRDEIEPQFRKLLEQHDRKFRRSASRDARPALREQEFDRRFHEHTNDVVVPIMTKPRTLMWDHDLHSQIVVTQRRTEADHKITPSIIAFEFRALSHPETHDFPITAWTLAFVADPSNDAVLVHENAILPFLGGPCRHDRPVHPRRPLGRTRREIPVGGGQEILRSTGAS